MTRKQDCKLKLQCHNDSFDLERADFMELYKRYCSLFKKLIRSGMVV